MLLEDELQPLPPTQARRVYKRALPPAPPRTALPQRGTRLSALLALRRR
jgi:hypothetical protein